MVVTPKSISKSLFLVLRLVTISVAT